MNRLDKLIARVSDMKVTPIPPQGLAQWNHAYISWMNSDGSFPFCKSEFAKDYSLCDDRCLKCGGYHG